MRKLAKTSAAAVIALGSLVAGVGAAHADSGNSATRTVESPWSDGTCTADIYLTGTSYDYAAAKFTNNTYDTACDFWLERAQYLSNGTSKYWSSYAPVGNFNPGSSWDVVSAGAPWTTGSYWDGPDYRMRACWQFQRASDYSDVYCTAGI